MVAGVCSAEVRVMREGSEASMGGIRIRSGAERTHQASKRR